MIFQAEKGTSYSPVLCERSEGARGGEEIGIELLFLSWNPLKNWLFLLRHLLLVLLPFLLLLLVAMPQWLAHTYTIAA